MDSTESEGFVMRRTKSQLVEENIELRRQLAVLKSKVAKISPATTPSANVAEHKTAKDIQNIGE